MVKQELALKQRALLTENLMKQYMTLLWASRESQRLAFEHLNYTLREHVIPTLRKLVKPFELDVSSYELRPAYKGPFLVSHEESCKLPTGYEARVYVYDKYKKIKLQLKPVEIILML